MSILRQSLNLKYNTLQLKSNKNNNNVNNLLHVIGDLNIAKDLVVNDSVNVSRFIIGDGSTMKRSMTKWFIHENNDISYLLGNYVTIGTTEQLDNLTVNGSMGVDNSISVSKYNTNSSLSILNNENKIITINENGTGINNPNPQHELDIIGNSLLESVIVDGSLIVNGTLTKIDSQNILINSSYFTIADNTLEESDFSNVDKGFFINRSSSISKGIIWQESTNNFKLIDTYDPDTINGTVNIINLADFHAKNLTSNIVEASILIGDANNLTDIIPTYHKQFDVQTDINIDNNTSLYQIDNISNNSITLSRGEKYLFKFSENPFSLFVASILSSKQENIVSWWKIDEHGNTNTIKNHISNSSNIGTLINYPENPTSSWTKGILKSALSFNGINNHVQLSYEPAVDINNNYAISLWINPKSTNNSGIINFTNSSNNKNGIVINSNVICGGFFDGIVLTGKCSNPLSINTWYHIALINAAGTVSLYVNNILQSTNFVTDVLGNNGENYIGYNSNSGYFNGLIDDIRLFDITLTSIDVNELYIARREYTDGISTNGLNVVFEVPLNAPNKLSYQNSNGSIAGADIIIAGSSLRSSDNNTRIEIDNSDIHFITNQNMSLSINDNENVAFGNIYPSEKLDINSSMKISGNLLPSTTNAHDIGTKNHHWESMHVNHLYLNDSTLYLKDEVILNNSHLFVDNIQVTNINATGIIVDENGTSYQINHWVGDGNINYDGKVGINKLNTIGSNNTLDIVGNTIVDGILNSTKIIVNSTTLKKSYWKKNDIIDDNRISYDLGNVGINITNPTADLHVSNGTIRGDYIIGNGSNLTNLPSNKWTTVSDSIYYNDGNLSIGTTDTLQGLFNVNGSMLISNSHTNYDSALNGTIRWTGHDFEGYQNDKWISLSNDGLNSTSTIINRWGRNDNKIYFAPSLKIINNASLTQSSTLSFNSSVILNEPILYPSKLLSIDIHLKSLLSDNGNGTNWETRIYSMSNSSATLKRSIQFNINSSLINQTQTITFQNPLHISSNEYIGITNLDGPLNISYDNNGSGNGFYYSENNDIINSSYFESSELYTFENLNSIGFSANILDNNNNDNNINSSIPAHVIIGDSIMTSNMYNLEVNGSIGVTGNILINNQTLSASFDELNIMNDVINNNNDFDKLSGIQTTITEFNMLNTTLIGSAEPNKAIIIDDNNDYDMLNGSMTVNNVILNNNIIIANETNALNVNNIAVNDTIITIASDQLSNESDIGFIIKNQTDDQNNRGMLWHESDKSFVFINTNSTSLIENNNSNNSNNNININSYANIHVKNIIANNITASLIQGDASNITNIQSKFILEFNVSYSNNSFLIDDILEKELTLLPGYKYKFNLNSIPSNIPFYITDNIFEPYNTGVSGNGNYGNDSIIFDVPNDSPGYLYYDSNVSGYGAKINIVGSQLSSSDFKTRIDINGDINDKSFKIYSNDTLSFIINQTTGNIGINGIEIPSEKLDIMGGIVIDGNVIFKQNNTFNIGTSNEYWNSLFSKNLYLSNDSLFINNKKILDMSNLMVDNIYSERVNASSITILENDEIVSLNKWTTVNTSIPETSDIYFDNNISIGSNSSNNIDNVNRLEIVGNWTIENGVLNTTELYVNGTSLKKAYWEKTSNIGGTSDNIIYNLGNVSINTIASQEKLHVNGTVKSTHFIGNGTFLTNKPTTKWTIDENQSTFYSNGSIGIGHNKTREQLDINGSIIINNNYVNNTVCRDGTIRFTGWDFEAQVEDKWESLTFNGTSFDDTNLWKQSGNKVFYSTSNVDTIGNQSIAFSGGNISSSIIILDKQIETNSKINSISLRLDESSAGNGSNWELKIYTLSNNTGTLINSYPFTINPTNNTSLQVININEYLPIEENSYIGLLNKDGYVGLTNTSSSINDNFWHLTDIPNQYRFSEQEFLYESSALPGFYVNTTNSETNEMVFVGFGTDEPAQSIDIDGNMSFTKTITINGSTITANAIELNTIKGLTAVAAEINILDGVTATAENINSLNTTISTGFAVPNKALITDSENNMNMLNGSFTVNDLHINNNFTILNDSNEYPMDINEIIINDSIILLGSEQSGQSTLDGGILVKKNNNNVNNVNNVGIIWDESNNEIGIIQTNNSGINALNMSINEYSNIHSKNLIANSVNASQLIGDVINVSYINPIYSGEYTITYNTTNNKFVVDNNENPQITLVRGQKYKFILTDIPQNNPFYITDDTLTPYNNGVQGNGLANTSVLLFNVPHNAPGYLYYESNTSNHGNKINITGSQLTSGDFNTYIALEENNLIPNTNNINIKTSGSTLPSITVSNDGNVGISEPNPNEKLVINGSTRIDGNILFSKNGTFNLGSSDKHWNSLYVNDLYLNSSSLYLNNEKILTNNSLTIDKIIALDINAFQLFITENNNSVSANKWSEDSNNEDDLYFLNNVSIGNTNTTGHRLEVDGNWTIDNGTLNTTQVNINGITLKKAYWTKDTSNINNIHYVSGNISINNDISSTPSDKLVVNGTARANYFIGNSSNLTGITPNKWNIMDNDSSSIYYNSGNVSIGYNLPTYRNGLDVNGSMIIGNSYNNYDTASINNGTLRWTGYDFEGVRNGKWYSLTENGSLFDDNNLWSSNENNGNTTSIYFSLNETIIGNQTIALSGGNMSSLAIIIDDPVLTNSRINSVTIQLDNELEIVNSINWEIRVYDMNENNGTLIRSHPIVFNPFANTSLQTIVIDEYLLVEEGNYIGIVNKDGYMGLTNTSSSNTDNFWYSNSLPNEYIKSTQSFEYQTAALSGFYAEVINNEGDNASFIGIRNSDPQYTLDIVGNMSFTDTLSINGTTLTSTVSELNKLSGLTASANEINILDGVTAQTFELNYLNNSNIGSASSSKALITDVNGNIDMQNGSLSINNLMIMGNITLSNQSDVLSAETFNINDTFIVLASNQTGVPAKDAGFIIHRDDQINKGIIWNELSDEIAFINTLDDGSYVENIDINSYQNIHSKNIIVNSINNSINSTNHYYGDGLNLTNIIPQYNNEFNVTFSNNVYYINGISQPQITLNRNEKYRFVLFDIPSNNPFYITDNTLAPFNNGVLGNGNANTSELIFSVPYNAPGYLSYNSNTVGLGAKINIVGSELSSNDKKIKIEIEETVSDNSNIVFSINNQNSSTSIITIDHNQQVGIGSNSSSIPAEKLDVDGNIRISGNVIPRNNTSVTLGTNDLRWDSLYVNELYLSNSSLFMDGSKILDGSTLNTTNINTNSINTTNITILDGGETVDINKWKGTSDDIYFLGNVGIGQASSTVNKLDVIGNTLVNGTVNTTELYVNGTKLKKAYWEENVDSLYYNRGNIGIGINDPQYSVHVNGTVRANYFIGNASNLTGLPQNKWGINPDNSIYYQGGNISIGYTSARDLVDVNGGILIANSYNDYYNYGNEGVIRYTGSNFEGFRSGEWKSLTDDGLSQNDQNVWSNNSNVLDSIYFAYNTTTIGNVSIAADGGDGILADIIILDNPVQNTSILQSVTIHLNLAPEGDGSGWEIRVYDMTGNNGKLIRSTSIGINEINETNFITPQIITINEYFPIEQGNYLAITNINGNMRLTNIISSPNDNYWFENNPISSYIQSVTTFGYSLNSLPGVYFTIQNNEISNNQTLVGIGTSTPAQNLDVVGDINIETNLHIAGTQLSATTSELNVADGITATTQEINIMSGVTASTVELNILNGTTIGIPTSGKPLITDSNNNLNLLDGTLYVNDLIISNNITLNNESQLLNIDNILVNDSVIIIASEIYGTPTKDTGLLIKRDDQNNKAIIWNESANEFAFIDTDIEGEYINTISNLGYKNIHAKSLFANVINASQFIGNGQEIENTVSDFHNTFDVTESNGNFSINGIEQAQISLIRGEKYKFNLIDTTIPFYISQLHTVFNRNVSNNGMIGNDTIEFDVPYDTPSDLYYLSNVIENNTFIDYNGSKINIVGGQLSSSDYLTSILVEKTENDNTIRFIINNSESMIIDENNKVFINYDNYDSISNSSELLNINGSMKITGNIIPNSNTTYNLGTSDNQWNKLFTNNLDFTSNSSIYLDNTKVLNNANLSVTNIESDNICGSSIIVQDGTTYNDINVWTGENNMYILNTKVAIGKDTATESLDVQGNVIVDEEINTGQLHVNGIEVKPITWRETPYNNDYKYINYPNNVGIGVSAPQEKLHVEGTIRSNYIIGNGSTLTNLPVTEWNTATNNNITYNNGSINIGYNVGNNRGTIDIDGSIIIGNSYQDTLDGSEKSGTVRWTGSDYETFANGRWNSMTSNGSDLTEHNLWDSNSSIIARSESNTTYGDLGMTLSGSGSTNVGFIYNQSPADQSIVFEIHVALESDPNGDGSEWYVSVFNNISGSTANVVRSQNVQLNEKLLGSFYTFTVPNGIIINPGEYIGFGNTGGTDTKLFSTSGPTNIAWRINLSGSGDWKKDANDTQAGLTLESNNFSVVFNIFKTKLVQNKIFYSPKYSQYGYSGSDISGNSANKQIIIQQQVIHPSRVYSLSLFLGTTGPDGDGTNWEIRAFKLVGNNEFKLMRKIGIVIDDSVTNQLQEIVLPNHFMIFPDEYLGIVNLDGNINTQSAAAAGVSSWILTTTPNNYINGIQSMTYSSNNYYGVYFTGFNSYEEDWNGNIGIGTSTPTKTVELVNRDVRISNNLYLANNAVRSSMTNINTLSGVTATFSELNKLTGVTASTSDLNEISNITVGATTSNNLVVTDSNNDLLLGNGDGDIFVLNTTIIGNLTTYGNVTEVNTDTYTVSDHIIHISTSNEIIEPIGDAAIMIKRLNGELNTAITWSEINDQFELVQTDFDSNNGGHITSQGYQGLHANNTLFNFITASKLYGDGTGLIGVNSKRHWDSLNTGEINVNNTIGIGTTVNELMSNPGLDLCGSFNIFIDNDVSNDQDSSDNAFATNNSIEFSNNHSIVYIDTVHGNVGIHSSNPSEALEVDGYVYGKQLKQHKDGSGVSNYLMDIQIDTELSNGDGNFRIKTFDYNNSEFYENMYIDTINRSIGLQTINPSATLDINGTLYVNENAKIHIGSINENGTDKLFVDGNINAMTYYGNGDNIENFHWNRQLVNQNSNLYYRGYTNPDTNDGSSSANDIMIINHSIVSTGLVSNINVLFESTSPAGLGDNWEIRAYEFDGNGINGRLMRKKSLPQLDETLNINHSINIPGGFQVLAGEYLGLLNKDGDTGIALSTVPTSNMWTLTTQPDSIINSVQTFATSANDPTFYFTIEENTYYFPKSSYPGTDNPLYYHMGNVSIGNTGAYDDFVGKPKEFSSVTSTGTTNHEIAVNESVTYESNINAVYFTLGTTAPAGDANSWQVRILKRTTNSNTLVDLTLVDTRNITINLSVTNKMQFCIVDPPLKIRPNEIFSLYNLDGAIRIAEESGTDNINYHALVSPTNLTIGSTDTYNDITATDYFVGAFLSRSDIYEHIGPYIGDFGSTGSTTTDEVVRVELVVHQSIVREVIILLDSDPPGADTTWELRSYTASGNILTLQQKVGITITGATTGSEQTIIVPSEFIVYPGEYIGLANTAGNTNLRINTGRFMEMWEVETIITDVGDSTSMTMIYESEYGVSFKLERQDEISRKLLIAGDVYANTYIGNASRMTGYTWDKASVLDQDYNNDSIYTNKKVGINNEAPTYELDICGSIKGTFAGDGATLSHNKWKKHNHTDSADTPLYFENNVGIGINSANPDHTLEVNGSSRISLGIKELYGNEEFRIKMNTSATHTYDSETNTSIDSTALKLWWKLDETGNEQDVIDSSGNSNNGSMSSFESSVSNHHTSNGKIGGALRFIHTANAERVDGPDMSSIITYLSDYTVSMWINTDELFSSARRIWQSTIDTNNRNGMWISDTNKINCGYYNGSSYDTVQTDDAITPNTWYHVMHVVSGQSTSLYLNGVAQTDITVDNEDLYGSALNFTLGDFMKNSPTYPDLTFKGMIDDVRVYNIALDSSEREYVYNYFAPVDSTQLYIDPLSNYIGIHTSVPNSSLHVQDGNILITNGSIYSDATELNIPDYVFEKDYNLLSLTEVEDYIRENKHLPNMGSEIELKSKLNINKLQMNLLEKIEELTLYTIQQQQEINELNNLNHELNNQITEIEEN